MLHCCLLGHRHLGTSLEVRRDDPRLLPRAKLWDQPVERKKLIMTDVFPFCFQMENVILVLNLFLSFELTAGGPVVELLVVTSHLFFVEI